MTVAKTTDAGKDRGIAFLKQKQHDRRMKMTEKLFEGLRVVLDHAIDKNITSRCYAGQRLNMAVTGNGHTNT